MNQCDSDRGRLIVLEPANDLRELSRETRVLLARNSRPKQDVVPESQGGGWRQSARVFARARRFRLPVRPPSCSGARRAMLCPSPRAIASIASWRTAADAITATKAKRQVASAAPTMNGATDLPARRLAARAMTKHGRQIQVTTKGPRERGAPRVDALGGEPQSPFRALVLRETCRTSGHSEIVACRALVRAKPSSSRTVFGFPEVRYPSITARSTIPSTVRESCRQAWIRPRRIA
jgi:hypothetical protein